jgi:phospholipid/cholesterol/gamma-HCH transport system ATP-binding protein
MTAAMAGGGQDTVIALRGIAKRFDRVHALRGVDLDLDRSAFTGIIGPGAAGKTVLVKIMAGLVKPDRGDVFVEGVNTVPMGELELQKVRSTIGMLFQNNALFDYLTVGENVAFPLRRMFSMSEDEMRTRVAERLERVGLGGMEDRFPASLSGGQKKRVGIARSTVARQPIIMYDDPTAGLDPVTASKIFLLLREEQQKTAATVIAVSSDVDSLIKYVDNLLIMNRGEVRFAGPVEDAFHAPDSWARAFVRGEWRGH